MTTTTRSRPRSLPSTTTKLSTEMGNLYVTVSTDEDGEPFEVFGWLGKGGSFQHGVTELACRLISLHLRRGTRSKRSSTSAGASRRCSPSSTACPTAGAWRCSASATASAGPRFVWTQHPNKGKRGRKMQTTMTRAPRSA